MENIGLLLKGIGLGFSITAPVGPIAIITVQRNLAHGLLTGLASGFGSALGDLVYGIIAGLGFVWIQPMVTDYQEYFQIIGGFYLTALGLKIFLTHPVLRQDDTNGKRPGFISTALLALANPMMLLVFTAIYAASCGCTNGLGVESLFKLVIGFFIGEMLWWTLLNVVVASLHTKFNENILRFVNQASGLALISFGGYVLWTGVTKVVHNFIASQALKVKVGLDGGSTVRSLNPMSWFGGGN
jgi:threonine/homoserine/homoserine lactone efflux protein